MRSPYIDLDRHHCRAQYTRRLGGSESDMVDRSTSCRCISLWDIAPRMRRQIESDDISDTGSRPVSTNQQQAHLYLLTT